MEPDELPGSVTGTEVAIDPSPGELASPERIGGSVAVAVVIALLLAVMLNRTAPRGPLVRLPLDQDRTHDTFADRTTEVPDDLPRGVVSLFQQAMERSRELLRGGLDRVFGRPIDTESLDALEEALLRSDVGVKTSERLLARVRETASQPDATPEILRKALRDEMRGLLDKVHAPLVPGEGLWVVLVVGVNGSGKTTTIGKLAARLKAQGRKVLIAAGDTYRAAAEQQLGVWAERAGVDIVSLDEGADPAAVAFTAVERARREGHDVVLVDTAGRLQTRKPLMEQLGKIRRVLDKAAPGAPHETLLVIDGTMGQNGMSQASLFNEATPVTGVVVTKLDGTAKGGMVFAIATELGLPVKLVGLGEKIGDLRDFEPGLFVDALV
jgi:fused signal recognition particle receptor